MVKTAATGKATALAVGEGGPCGIFSDGIAIRPISGDLFLDPGSERPVIRSGTNEKSTQAVPDREVRGRRENFE
jgi:hypothetical protein